MWAPGFAGEPSLETTPLDFSRWADGVAVLLQDWYRAQSEETMPGAEDGEGAQGGAI